MKRYIINVPSDQDELAHYNHNHDHLGRFARSGFGGSVSSKSSSPIEKATRGSEELIRNTRRLVGRQKQPSKSNYSHLSNEELAKRVNRLQLEQRYSELTRPTYSRGRQRALEVLDYAGDVMAIAASGAIIGTQIYKIRHG